MFNKINGFVAAACFAFFAAAGVPVATQADVPATAQAEVPAAQNYCGSGCTWPYVCIVDTTTGDAECKFMPAANGVRLHGVRVGDGSLHGASLQEATDASQCGVE